MEVENGIYQSAETEQLSNPNKTRARGPSGRRPPSFKHSKGVRRQKIGGQNSEKEPVDMGGEDVDNNNVSDIENAENEHIEVLAVSEVASNDNVDNDDGDIGSSLKRRLWNACLII
eukprot:GFUD01035422.1.p1 GENE.GFUD01035422.1~~GFUD01035422.1.p1  ORF type:complete len:116 (-),score=37.54 GFUD01035422.1:43-390(-)